MKVIFSNKAYLSILSETSEKIATETGGIFLGCFEDETFYIIEAIDPGPKSTFQIAYFEYDQKYTQHLINKIARLYDYKLTLVGLWHRHPGSFDQFSSTDNGTNLQYAKMNKYGAVSILVNIDPNFRITAYHVDNPLKYSRIVYEINDKLIPEHIKKPKSVEEILAFINDYEKRRVSADKISSRTNLGSLMDVIKPYFQIFKVENLENEKVKADISNHREYVAELLLDDITFLSEDKGIVISIMQDDNCITISQKDGKFKIYFTYFPSEKQIVFSFGDACYVYAAGLFEKLLKEKVSEVENKNSENSFKNDLLRSLGFDKYRR